MKRKKYILSRMLDASGLFHLWSKIPVNQLVVINYHRIYDGVLNTAFDDEVFGPSVDEFEQQMRWVVQNADCLSEDDLLDFIRSNRKFPKRCVLITFDDGYRDNFDLAFPILNSLHVPAIFFIPVGAIEQRRLGWWDIIAYFVKKTKKQHIEVYGKTINMSGQGEKNTAISFLLDLMKSTPYTKSKDLLQILSKECDVPFPSKKEQGGELMSWQQLKEIRGKNISIGSHTYSHRTLSTIDEDQQVNELKESKEILEEKIGCKVQSIGYPVGNYTAFTKRTKEIAKDIGYKMGFSFTTGINERVIGDPFDIKRIVVPNELPLFKGTLLVYSIFKERYDSKFTDVSSASS